MYIDNLLCMHHVLLRHQTVRKWYHSNRYQEDTQYQMIEFEEDNIVLDLPAGESEPEVVDEWKILPLTYPEVKIKLTISLHINLPTRISFYMSIIIDQKS